MASGKKRSSKRRVSRAVMQRVEEERVVDFDECQQLRETRQTILDELFRVALADAQVSDDERQLLLRAMELVPTLRPRARSAAD